MRIAFLGKGGAGKTTTSAGFVQYLAQRHPFVVAVDADVNAHMKEALSLNGEAKQLGLYFEQVVDYLRGARVDLGTRPMIGTTPPSSLSQFIVPTKQDKFIKDYALIEGNIALLTVGTYQQEDVGGSCYHEKLKSLAGIFHHMLDGEEDLVVADTTAGTDIVATSLSFAYDMNVFVLEPTEKSTQVFLDYIAIAPQYADRTYVVGNKIDSEEDAQYIQSRVGTERYLGSIPFSKNLKRFEQGDEEAIIAFHKEQEATFEKVLAVWKSHKRNWQNYQELLKKTFLWDCGRWYNDFHGLDLSTDLDAEFSYEKTASALREKQPALQAV